METFYKKNHTGMYGNFTRTIEKSYKKIVWRNVGKSYKRIIQGKPYGRELCVYVSIERTHLVDLSSGCRAVFLNYDQNSSFGFLAFWIGGTLLFHVHFAVFRYLAPFL